MPPKWTPQTTITIDINAQLGGRLKKARKNSRLSAYQLGMIVGVSKYQIWRYESGETPLTVYRLHQLAQHLNLPMAYFYERLGDDEKWHRCSFILRN